MDNNDIRTKITIIDNETKKQVFLPVILSLPTAQMLIEDAMKSNLIVTIEPVL